MRYEVIVHKGPYIRRCYRFPYRCAALRMVRKVGRNACELVVVDDSDNDEKPESLRFET